MKRLFQLLILALLLLPLTGSSQSFYFRNYSVEDGLPFINVSTIFQDNKGNLWSGGYGGLSKFDGNSFTNYSPKEGLLNHYVTCITQDNQGDLWLGTISGVNKFNGKLFTGYTTTHGLISNSVTACLKDTKGHLWFGTDKGISKLVDGAFINFTTADGLPGNSIRSFCLDKRGNVWIGTTAGACVFDGKNFTSYGTSNGLASNEVNGIAQDLQGNMWFATANGLCELKGSRFICYSGEQGLEEKDIRSILVDNKNVIWLGTGKGLVKFQDNRFSKYLIKRDQNSNLIACLYQDYENNLWIGTYAGLFKYRGNPFVSYGIHDGLTNNFIFGILRDSKGTLWVGSQGGGLYRFDEDGFTQFDRSNGFNAQTVNAIYEYEPGLLWIATENGLKKFDGQRVKPLTDSSSVFRNSINCFFKDSKNNIWIGGRNEIFKYDGTGFTVYPFKGRHENSEVWTIIEDRESIIWAGSYLGGLAKLQGNTFVECSAQLGLKNDSYMASLIDREGNLYFGSLDGVWMFNPENPSKTLVSFTKEDGMSSDLVYSILFSKTQNEIWAGTNQGLNRINLAEYKKIGQKNIIPFGKLEGFSGVECNSGGFVDADGTMWFGTVYGLIKYDPSEYIPNRSESKTSITGFRLFYKDTLLPKNVHLAYNDNNITFNYSGICLTNPSKVKYSHILEGADRNWSPPSTERFATYSNLPPGTYTFKVISSNNEGVWNKSPASFTFTINRPFWKTWWFIVFSTCAAVILLALSIRYRIRQIKHREKRKTELNKKIAQIESQALRAQMNPHFIFNTLSSIQHYISNNNTDAALKYLSKFAKLMRRIMDNSKQQMIPVSEEIGALELYLELEVMRFDNKFKYLITVDETIDQNYDRIPSMLIQPYVENAIIHGLLPKEGPGKIIISLQRQADTILCIIEDNGIGRERSKEFKKHRIQQHKSMGMSITQERLDILNSSLKSNLNAEIIDLYESGKPAGTRVRLVIPLEAGENN